MSQAGEGRLMLRLLLHAELEAAVVVAGAVIVLIGGVLAGYQIHRALYYGAPAIGRRLPSDAGAWAGLCVAGLLLLA